MEISDSAYMSVELLIRLAAQDGDSPYTMRALADWIDRPELYTHALMARLRKAGLITARPGDDGGYTLVKPAHRITVAEVFHAIGETHDRPNHSLHAITFEPEKVEAYLGTTVAFESLKSHLLLLFLDRISLDDIAPANAGKSSQCGARPIAVKPHRPPMSLH